MQYGRFRNGITTNVALTAAAIGTLLEQEFEQRGIFTELPTSSDWGYTFRTKIEKQSIDVSVVDHDDDGFGVALEFPKRFLNLFYSHKQKKAIEFAKTISTEVLGRISAYTTLSWFSRSEWIEAFETDFWQQSN